MTVTDYLLHLFYLIDTEIQAMNLHLRQRGPQPRLSDSEVITILLAGEFLGIDTDKGIYCFFCRYHGTEFPALSEVDRTTFARQAAALWRVTKLLQDRLLARLPVRDPMDGEALWLIDSFPLRVCRLSRAHRCKRFGGVAGYGHDPAAWRDCFYGFRVHVRCSDRGPCTQVELTAANIADSTAAAELAPPASDPGLCCIGDRGYWGPLAREGMARRGSLFLAPFKQQKIDPFPKRSQLLTRLRKGIETVIGQLAERFHVQRTWARDLWHLCGRINRKILSHTAAVLINWTMGNPPLQLDLIIPN
jgi:hypothetical protein